MKLVDFHVHTAHSPDASYPMEVMAKVGIKAGLATMCFTDHCDIGHYDMAGVVDTACYENWRQCLPQYRELSQALAGQIELLLGMELGHITLEPSIAEEVAKTPELDFVIGSVHAIKGYKDFFCLDYHSMEGCIELNRKYFEESMAFVRLGHFDVLGHVGYTGRYMKRAGFDVDIMIFEEQLRALFAALVQSGKGIEVNTSGLRQGYGSTFPVKSVLELYKACGGEIITVGSDAHRPREVGTHIRDVLALLSQIGFQYVTVFRNRKPSFISIDN